MQNLTVHPGGPSPFLLGPAHACPRTRAPTAADRPVLPPGTVSRTTRQTSLASLFPPATRARRTLPASAALGPLLGAIHRSGPGPTAPPRRVAPSPFPPLFPSAALPPSHSLPARAAPLVLPSPLLSDPSTRAPKPPHRSLHPDRRLQLPAAHSPLWIPAEHRRRPPLPGKLLPELPIPAFSYNFSPPCLSGAAGPHTHHRHPPEPPPHR
jgi:hypothetical protein